MAAAAAGIFNHSMAAAAAALKGHGATTTGSTATATASASGTDSSGAGGTSTDSSTISANDFLTLLVTEMQNQDPTAETDPNEYIDQLVQVNSLEQLININQTLSTDLGGAAATAPSGESSASQPANVANGGASKASIASATHTAGHRVSATPAQSGNAAAALKATQGSTQGSTPRSPGNLAVPGVNQAGQRVGHSLDGRTPRRAAPGSGPAGE